MSFSGEIKEELSQKVSTARHCQIAELAAIMGMCGGVVITSGDRYRVKIQTDSLPVARKCFTLLQKIFNIEPEVSIRQHQKPQKTRIYSVLVPKHEDALRVLQALKLIDGHMEIREKRAFIRGAFLSTGSMSDPNKSYHFEIVCSSEAKARQIQELIGSFDMDAKIVCRKRYFVVYLKEGAQIVDLLNVMEAHVALMDLENVRIFKEMRNSVNRKVNCETANIHKTVSAAVKQIEDIEFLKAAGSFSELSDELLETAGIRLENPDASLKELGLMHNPPIGKSGVNHRLRKLSNLAETLRGSKEEQYYD